jgi:hypothetical protein
MSVRDGLSLGSSRHWTEALQIMTGESKMNGSALLEYFQPLYEFLKAENNVEQHSEDSSDDQTIPIVVGAVLLGVVVVVIVGYLIFRRRAAKRNANA